MSTKKLKDWHPADIKAQLSKRGYSLRDVARKYGLPEQTCSSALSGTSRQGEDAIAAALGLKPQQIWPSRFEKRRYAVRSKLKLNDSNLSLSKMQEAC